MPERNPSRIPTLRQSGGSSLFICLVLLGGGGDLIAAARLMQNSGALLPVLVIAGIDVGCDQQLNEIAVSARGTLGGLTQFCGRLSLPRFKPLSAKGIEERLAKSTACAIIPSKPLANRWF